MFDGTIKKFAQKLVTALEEQALRRFEIYQGDTTKSTYLSVCITLKDLASILRQVAELDAKTTNT